MAASSLDDLAQAQRIEALTAALAKAQAERDDAHRRETATAEVLGVISKCTTDVQPVFDAILVSSKSLLGAHSAVVSRVVGRELVLAAYTPINPTADDELKHTYPHLLEGTGLAVFVVREGVRCVVSDTETDDRVPSSLREVARRRGYRSLLIVPMLSMGTAIGTINVSRSTPGAFSDKDIALLQTFADQAVIAIENTRLFEAEQARTRELSEALEQQTAACEVLGIISSSPGKLQPVFETMLANATRICGAQFGNLLLYEGDGFRHVATHGAPAAFAELRRRDPVVRPGPKSTLGRIAAKKQVQHIADITTGQAYLDRNPATVELADAAGARTLLGVPLLKDNELIGVIAIYRQEVRPFTHKQVELLKTFADQAVIAIENTRLLNELRESLQQQTATADVLKVISRATFDLARVLDTLVESAATLCDSYDTAILQKDSDVLRIVAHHGPTPHTPFGQPRPLTRGAAIGRAVLDRQAIHLADMQSETDEYPESSANDRRLGFRTMLVVPLVGASEAVGAIALRRSEVRPFTDRQIELRAVSSCHFLP
jgi:GAF domain-containing protein